MERVRPRPAIARCAVSAMTLAIALGCQSAAAEDARLIFEARGGWLTGDEQPWVEVDPDDFRNIGASSLFGGTIGIVAPAGELFNGFNGWDVGLFARLGLSNEANEAIGPDILIQVIGIDQSPFAFGQVEHREHQAVIDLEARRPVSLLQDHGAETTLKLGARFAYFGAETEADFDLGLAFPYVAAHDDRKSEFIGLGPHIGLETSIPLHDNAWLDLGAGASLLFGKRYTSAVTNTEIFIGFPDDFGSGFSRTSWRLVPGLDARAALKFAMANSPMTLSVGVDANAWFGVYDMKALYAPAGGKTNANRFEISPFINLSMPLGDDPFGEDRPKVAQSDTTAPVLELGLWGAGLWRNGGALNSSGGTPNELEDFPLAGLSGLAAFRLRDAWIAQAEIAGEARLGSDTTNGIAVDDTFNEGFSAGGQLAWTRGPLLLSTFAGAGKTNIATDSPPSQDADHWFAGVQGRVTGKRHAFAVQVGHVDSSAGDDEVISNALFGRVIAQAFFNDGRTKLQGDFAYVSGDQDPDDFEGLSPVAITSWGLEVEHQLDRRIGGANLSAFLSYQGAYVDERSTSGNHETLTDTTVLAGLRIRTGAGTPLERARMTAPDMPNVVRWIGSVPAVD